MADLLILPIGIGLFVLPLLMAVLPLARKESKHTFSILILFFAIIPLILSMSLIFQFYPRTLFLNDFVYFSFSQNGLWVALITYLMCGILFVLSGRISHLELSKQEVISCILSLWVANIAFFAGNFLLRFIFLELLALGIVLLLFFNSKTWDGFSQAGIMFLFLKTGALGMLIGIIILQTQTGILNIQSALDLSNTLPLSVLTWVQAGFLLTVIVKMGVWPFEIWIAYGIVSTKRSLTWFSMLLLPAMGLYLLYRITPMFASNSLSSYIVFYGAFSLAIIGTTRSVFKPVKQRALLLGTLLGSLALMIASFGSSKLVLWYFVITMLTRTGFELLTRAKNQHKIGYSILSVISVLLILGNLWEVKSWATIPQVIVCIIMITLIVLCFNLRGLQLFPNKLSNNFKGFQKIPDLLGRFEQKYFQAGVEKFTLIAIRVVQWIYFAFEFRFIEIITNWGVKALSFSVGTLEDRGFTQGGNKFVESFLKASQRIKKLEERSFRKNLLWIPLMLLMAILFLAFFPSLILENK